MSEPKFDGALIKLGGRDLTVPPLSFRQLKRYWSLISTLSDEKDPMKINESTCEITHAALSRNYDDITREDIEDWLDNLNVKMVINAVLGASGFFAPKGTLPENPQTGT